jgi:hypothetical protein
MLLAAMTVCAMSVTPVFAEGEGGGNTSAATVPSGQITNDKGITTLPFTKMLIVNDAKIMTETTYSFTMEPSTPTEDTKNGSTYSAGLPLKTSTVEIKVNNAKLNDAANYSGVANTSDATFVEGFTKTEATKAIKLDSEFKLEFKDDQKYTTDGIYRYAVNETYVQSASGTIGYDRTTFYVDLYTDYQGNIYQLQTYTSDTKKPIVFENNFKTSTLTISKTVKDDDKVVDPNKDYTFYIKIPTGGTSIDLENGVEIAAKIKTSDKPDEDVTLTVGGTMDEENDPATAMSKNTSDGWNSFTLKDGQSLEIAGIPAHMVYYLFEEDYSTQNFETNYIKKSVAANGTVEAPSVSDYTGDEGRSGNIVDADLALTGTNTKDYIYYLNTYKKVTNTGISLDILPYAAVVLAAAAACVVLLISRKRRSAR